MRRLEGYENVDNVLSILADFHRHLANMFRLSGEHQSGERARLLLNYLSDHQAKRAAALEDFRKDAAPSLMKNWFQIPFPEAPQTFLDGLDLSGEVGEDEIHAVVSRVDDFMSRLLNYVKSRAETTNVRELFEDLLSIEERERVLRSRALSSFSRI